MSLSDNWAHTGSPETARRGHRALKSFPSCERERFPPDKHLPLTTNGGGFLNLLLFLPPKTASVSLVDEQQEEKEEEIRSPPVALIQI